MKDIRLKEILQLYTKEDLWNYNQEKLEQLAMKDHEVEILKNTQNQKAIECLECVRAILNNRITVYYTKNGIKRFKIDVGTLNTIISQKIRELKGGSDEECDN